MTSSGQILPKTSLKPRGNLAIFDLDYTLTVKGTWGRFIASTLKGRPHLWPALIWVMAKNQLLYKLGMAPRCGVKKAMMFLTIVGWPKAKVQEYANAFAQNEVLTGLRPGAIAALEAHRAAGDTLIIASAAVDVVVAPICEALGIEHFVATVMAWEHDCLAPEFTSENCHGEQKLVELKAYLEQNPDLKQKHTKITMYSDCDSDLDILLWADVGVAVDPSKRLKFLAKQHGFQTVSWL